MDDFKRQKERSVAVLKQLAKQVQEREPDTWMYLCHTPDFTQPSLPTPSENDIIFFEIYKNESAFYAHVKGKTFTEFVKKHGHLFLQSNGKPFVVLEILTRLGGFVRTAQFQKSR